MSVVIIIGSGGAHKAIEDANAAASGWTAAQKAAMSQKFDDFTKAVEAFIANPPQ